MWYAQMLTILSCERAKSKIQIETRSERQECESSRWGDVGKGRVLLTHQDEGEASLLANPLVVPDAAEGAVPRLIPANRHNNTRDGD